MNKLYGASTNFYSGTGHVRSVPDAPATDRGSKIVIRDYVPDSPGYYGDVVFELGRNTLTQTAKCTLEFQLPLKMAALIAVSDYSSATHASWVWSFLSENTKDYLLGQPKYIDPERVKVLTFAGGVKGFLMMHGDSASFTLVVGPYALNFAGGKLVGLHEQATA